MEEICPLCSSKDISIFIQNLRGKDYYKCSYCFLIFMDSSFHLSYSEQKLRYDFHENSIKNEGYVTFLNKCIQPTLPYLESLNSNQLLEGLDYGSGPNPTLSQILGKLNYKVENFDPIYKKHFPQSRFDFIFSTEVWEHFHNPFQEIQKIKSLLKPKGILTVMTSSWNEHINFSNWYYPKDDTHVSFYHNNTFDRIDELFNLKLVEKSLSNVWIFQNRG